MEKKLIDLHFEWMETGTMGKLYNAGGGLCNFIPAEYIHLFDLFIPTQRELDVFEENDSPIFWASGLQESYSEYSKLAYLYTPRRQSIVLLICAMYGEI